LQLAGASAVDHLPFLKEKLSFERLGVDIPSPTACRAWLKEFHNPNEDIKRGMGKAFIPESNRHLVKSQNCCKFGPGYIFTTTASD
jgi:hypothetical protein